MIIKFLFWFVLGAAAWALFAGLGIEVYELTKRSAIGANRKDLWKPVHARFAGPYRRAPPKGEQAIRRPASGAVEGLITLPGAA